MLESCDIMAFVSTTGPARARAFYEGTLGLRLVSDDDFAAAFDAHGVTLRVTKVEQLTPQPWTVLGWIVPDIERAMRELAAKGVTFERYEGMPQDEHGAWTVPGKGVRIAWFKDPDGNLLSLTQ
ncbi:MAG: VOC family protein [Dehalococcoidia bacterium]